MHLVTNWIYDKICNIISLMDQNSLITKTSIPGLILVQRPTLSDERGFFREPVRIAELEEAGGVEFAVKQMNHARSAKNTLRGIHIAPWNKLVYVVSGNVQNVIIDLRVESPAFGKHESFIIGDDNRSSIFIPKGCGNAYLVLTDEADYTYLTDSEWSPNMEKSIIWNDPALGIKWELEGDPLLSEKDQDNPSVRKIFPEF